MFLKADARNLDVEAFSLASGRFRLGDVDRLIHAGSWGQPAVPGAVADGGCLLGVVGCCSYMVRHAKKEKSLE